MTCLFYLPIMSFYFGVLAETCLPPSTVARVPNRDFSPVCQAFISTVTRLLARPHPHPPHLLLLPPLDLCHQEVATSVSFERGGSTSQEHFASIAHNHSMDGDIWYSRRLMPVWSIKTLSASWPAWRYYPRPGKQLIHSLKPHLRAAKCKALN